jgi:hypothetical protein
VLANQATMWHALRLAGITDCVSGFGHLFALDADTADECREDADVSRRSLA